MNLLSLVWTNLGRNTLRTTLTVLSVFVALFLFCALRGLTDTLSDTIKVSSEQRLVVRNKLSLVFPLPQSQYAQLEGMPGVKAATWSNWFGGTDPKNAHDFYAHFVVDAKTYFPIYADDIDIVAASPNPGGPLPPGLDPKLAAFMSERTARVGVEGLMKSHGWSAGQTVHLNGTIYHGDWPFTIRPVNRPK